ncbi:cytochrome c/c1 heme lyase-domain-containing protein [Phascolomyces articulosus]|uniref:Holocytochrome c-type synthase n=1 Tax=Phascolomyces articulosus TaxID=60185 RepID=A0AAD5KJN6_9FUNG|nr:cytochrome c/c1 heme lyase-domain-containing protein [Phascolomyces articulosus]
MSTENKCPVDHTNMKSTPPPQQQQPTDAAKCPVDHTKFQSPPTTNTNSEEKCPVDPSAYQHFLPKDQKAEAEKCPVDPAAYKHFLPSKEQGQKQSADEGCDSDAIDARNNMPSVAQQSPTPGQKMALGVEREVSTIPRADTEEKNWIYPSEQMFFNAMRRKNWNPEEKDMSVVVPIHNAVNEMAWMKILEWEKMHHTECNQPKLVKFQGRPKDYTPKARLYSWFGRPESISFYLDVRPAVSLSGIWDRVRMSFKKGEFI